MMNGKRQFRRWSACDLQALESRALLSAAPLTPFAPPAAGRTPVVMATIVMAPVVVVPPVAVLATEAGLIARASAMLPASAPLTSVLVTAVGLAEAELAGVSAPTVQIKADPFVTMKRFSCANIPDEGQAPVLAAPGALLFDSIQPDVAENTAAVVVLDRGERDFPLMAPGSETGSLGAELNHDAYELARAAAGQSLTVTQTQRPADVESAAALPASAPQSFAAASQVLVQAAVAPAPPLPPRARAQASEPAALPTVFSQQVIAASTPLRHVGDNSVDGVGLGAAVVWAARTGGESLVASGELAIAGSTLVSWLDGATGAIGQLGVAPTAATAGATLGLSAGATRGVTAGTAGIAREAGQAARVAIGSMQQIAVLPANVVYRFASFDPVATFVDAMAAFAGESASVPPISPAPLDATASGRVPRRAMAVTAAVLAVDAMLGLRWLASRRAARRKCSRAHDSLFPRRQADPLPLGL